MANNCINYVSFRGDEENIKNFKHSLKQKIEESISNGEYVWGNLGDWRGVYFENYLDENEQDYNHFVCVSAWSPEIDLFKLLSQMFNVEFFIEFEELGNGVVGCIQIKPTETKINYLSSSEIDSAYDKIEEDWDFEALEIINLEAARKAGLDIF